MILRSNAYTGYCIITHYMTLNIFDCTIYLFTKLQFTQNARMKLHRHTSENKRQTELKKSTLRYTIHIQTHIYF